MSGPRLTRPRGFVQSSAMPSDMERSKSGDAVPHDEKTRSRSRASEDAQAEPEYKSKFTLGILRDKQTDSVPGSVLLLGGVSGNDKRNAPLGMHRAPHRSSQSSLPSVTGRSMLSMASLRSPRSPVKKRTADGKIILDPQPDDSENDPLNWSSLRRDAALLSLGLYCLVGGGMTPILAAGFNNVASTYGASIPQVALTTGLYMLGLGVGSVIMSPTAIIFGKRPVYLMTAIMFILTSIWCALSPNYDSLLVARIFQGIAVSPTECLPSASIAEIFFLHERAYRLGIYTLLLLGGKNLVPLVSAAIIQNMHWRWVFWIVAIVVAFSGLLLFLFVPETFWDRTPRPHVHRPKDNKSRGGLISRQLSALTLGLRSPRSPRPHKTENEAVDAASPTPSPARPPLVTRVTSPSPERRGRSLHARFDLDKEDREELQRVEEHPSQHPSEDTIVEPERPQPAFPTIDTAIAQTDFTDIDLRDATTNNNPTPGRLEAGQQDTSHLTPAAAIRSPGPQSPRPQSPGARSPSIMTPAPGVSQHAYTAFYQKAPPKSFLATLKPYDGRISTHAWWKLALRPFVLYTYPSILWSAVVYALSVGWLIVLSESVANIYRASDTYNFTALQAGLVYISPFIGGVLGTAVAGKVSDVIVRYMSRKNGGLYEPEFRLVMAIPVTLTTTIGLMGYGWSAQNHDRWIVPTMFFGIISFGCSLGSTTAITFAVDSYRMYAGEALVTLNFSKNILHGLVFSLFFTDWLEHDGPREVFLVLGGIQLVLLLTTIPMYMYGKRARMWTTRKAYVEKL